MPPTLILIRHAQANYSIPDPVLTENGVSQCQELRENLVKTLPGKFDPELILVSPMRRTLQTALLSLDWLLKEGVPIQAHAGWQENEAKPCDTGTPIATVAKEFPEVDFSHVDPVYPDKTSPRGSHYAHSKEALLNRAQTSLAELHRRPEKVIVVVSHSAFMRKAVTGCWFFNADYRIFDFEARGDGTDGATAEPYRLRQWDQTFHGHGGMGKSWDEMIPIGALLPDA